MGMEPNESLESLLDKILQVRVCGVCGEGVQTVIKETSRTMKITSKHFCPVMNGKLKAERIYKKK